MAGLDDLSRGELQDILRRLRILETASPLQNASIGENGLRVYDGGVITIENGGLNVTGTATIHGTLNADGTINFTGPVTISGPMTVSGTTNITGATTVTGDFAVTGPTHLNGVTDVAGNTTVTGSFTTVGPMKTTGTLSVEGATTLKSDLNVTAGGKIAAGNVTIDPSILGGAVTFSSGAYIVASGGGVVINSSDGVLIASPLIADSGVKLSSLPLTSSPANLYADPSTGVIYRSTA